MKKIIKIILILVLCLSFLAGLVFWRMKWVEKRYDGDYQTLEKEILLPDTDGKGFSDKVKKDIDKNFPNEEIRKSLYKVAISDRKLARSQNKEDFIKYSKESSINYSCFLFMKIKYPNEFLNDKYLLGSKITYDTPDMKKYSDFLNYFRFGDADFDNMMTDLRNAHQIYTQEKYDKSCLE